MHDLEKTNFADTIKTLQEAFTGRTIVSAASSLNKFAIELSGEVGFLIECAQKDDEPFIEAKTVPAGDLPKLSEAVCTVDWSWIEGSTVEQITLGEKSIRLSLVSAGLLTVSTANWQGKPFLSFQPYKPAKKA